MATRTHFLGLRKQEFLFCVGIQAKGQYDTAKSLIVAIKASLPTENFWNIEEGETIQELSEQIALRKFSEDLKRNLDLLTADEQDKLYKTIEAFLQLNMTENEKFEQLEIFEEIGIFS
jgi:sugar diacid utilization regulator